jgi:hypothetical protein
VTTASRDRERHTALAVLLSAHKRYGTKSFKVDPNGHHWKPLHDAEKLGWCWFVGPRCAILDAGLRELEPYRRNEPRPVVQWICPICLHVSAQAEDEAGLPERPHCENCSSQALQMTETMRERA